MSAGGWDDEGETEPEKQARAHRKIVTGEDYEKTWGTPVGQDCIDLNETLARWLGERLVFLAKHTMTVKTDAAEPRHGSLRRNGEALLRYAAAGESADVDEAKRALEWVEKNLESLWD